MFPKSPNMELVYLSPYTMSITFFIAFLFALLIQAQDQSGFISIDCGAPADANYTESSTGIKYISDANFINTGVSKRVVSELQGTYQRHMWTARSFPDGKRNCYNINITRGSTYLIGTNFLYGNYDGLNESPNFDLHLGPNRWDTVTINNASENVYYEIIHVPSLDYIQICLVDTGYGTPFISSIEIRTLKNDTYVTQYGSLKLYWRCDLGMDANDTGYRYSYDVYDRYWTACDFNQDWTSVVNELITDDSLEQNDYKPPAVVMSTAVTPANASAPLVISWEPEDENDQLYAYLHFTEIQVLAANQTREFNIMLNGESWYEKQSPQYLHVNTIYSQSAFSGKEVKFSLEMTKNSTLPPIISAIEIYKVIDFQQLNTFQGDVDAITSLQSVYEVTRDWQGDPCAPVAYLWHGLNCSYPVNDFPRIITLNLSSSRLSGKIDPSISKLTMLEKLDLSNNSLNDEVPDFLTQLQHLKILNLENNNLSGSIPSALVEKSKKGSLSLSVSQNPHLCESGQCNTKDDKKNQIVTPLVASISGVLILLAVVTILWTLKRRKSRGGFGTVYLGYIDDTPVAVKMLSPSSVRGYQQFQAEVKLLMRVHHKNLTSLIGYCNEETSRCLIYEYMANGNLQEHLSGKHNKSKFLSWEDRLRITLDAASGLEYLQNGCKPPIIHRDVKSTNILLNEHFQAKLSDFGLSKIIPTDGGSHVSTVVAGTLGYLDPHYSISSRLTEKSDVYSFGVVLLEIITNQPVIARTQDKGHISEKVNSLIATGDINGIVDSRLEGDFDINSAWKAVELAMNCVSLNPNERPTMSVIVIEIKAALATELARTYGRGVDPRYSVEPVSLNLDTEFMPLASIDCGAPACVNYTESSTGIIYISDANFINTGESKSVVSELKSTYQQQMWTLRSFPVGKRNCFKVNITRGSRYLIRTNFLYGNYDGLNKLPDFDLHLGPNRWDTVTIQNASTDVYYEIIHVPSLDYIQLCLADTGNGTPFISSIEIRTLKNDTYVAQFGSALQLYRRCDIGANTTVGAYRYKYDVYDRFWGTCDSKQNWTSVQNASIATASFGRNHYQLPAIVMSTAVTPTNASAPLVISWKPQHENDQFHAYLHFTEIQVIAANQTRQFNITVGESRHENFSSQYHNVCTAYTRLPIRGKEINFTLEMTKNSTLPPIINAIEVYKVIELQQLNTFKEDVEAISSIMSVYEVTRDWQGDPCAPVAYLWYGLNCSYPANDFPRITTLNLSSSGLSGKIDPSISKLTMLENLDLSNNSLNDEVPDFLSQLRHLKFLNLENNNLSGSVPSALAEKSKKVSLSLSVGQNPYLCESGDSGQCNENKKNNIITPLVASISGVLILLVVMAILWTLKRRKTREKLTALMVERDQNQILRQNTEQDDSLRPPKKQIYSYSDVIKITNNFNTVIGKGGFGSVYLGYIDDTPVAVKMLSPSSVRGYQQYQAEVKLLMRVHHKNLTSLIGYCNEETNTGLIYEYMANGNLQEHLSGKHKKSKFLSWEDRLRIAVDAASGLEYLQNGCKSPIIHRDVKSTNILLNEHFQAKLSDFGLSKIIPTDGGSHVSTVVAGTFGYLDPHYSISSRLTEKSDVYSFGVVLLEIITNQPVIARTQDKGRISEKVNSLIATGDINGIVDSRLQGDFDINSAWKAVEIAMDCVPLDPNERPTMSVIVVEIKAALATELARTYGSGDDPRYSVEPVTMNLDSEFMPLAR
ncbi:hypothetical protein Fmac_019899 [Flemingia macrophylla]|uniref:non-specific serine/threonine protein kinase n=1 Tax=Flemingia macrophylla TaxID=520843 RepID=A0ABD1M947_9FABA